MADESETKPWGSSTDLRSAKRGTRARCGICAHPEHLAIENAFLYRERSVAESNGAKTAQPRQMPSLATVEASRFRQQLSVGHSRFATASCRSIDPLILFVVFLLCRYVCHRHGLVDGLSDFFVVGVGQLY